MKVRLVLKMAIVIIISRVGWWSSWTWAWPSSASLQTSSSSPPSGFTPSRPPMSLVWSTAWFHLIYIRSGPHFDKGDNAQGEGGAIGGEVEPCSSKPLCCQPSQVQLQVLWLRPVGYVTACSVYLWSSTCSLCSVYVLYSVYGSVSFLLCSIGYIQAMIWLWRCQC